jgi:hypothetical protein
VDNCKKCYYLGENVTIDEKLEAFRGGDSLKQYIPSKPNKYGIKIYALVDAKVLYTYNLEIHAGKQPDGLYQVSSKPADVVKRLVEPINGTGHNIKADNWFMDTSLVFELRKRKLSYVDTLKKNKPQLPVEFVVVKNRPEKSSLFGYRKEATVVSYIPKKGKNVILISSLHFDDAIDCKTGSQLKPEIVTFYNRTKCGIDNMD